MAIKGIPLCERSKRKLGLEGISMYKLVARVPCHSLDANARAAEGGGRMRLIDADALDDLIESHLLKHKISRYDRDLILHYTDVEMAPTIEAELVKQGQWKPLFEEYAIDWMQCSECGAEFFGKTNYCPHCGAKMEDSI